MQVTSWCSNLRHLQELLVGQELFGAWDRPLVVNVQGWGTWDMPMMRGGWGIVMMLLMLLFWAAVIVVIIVGIRWLMTSNRSDRRTMSERETESALDVLKKRYARGDISKQEFEDMRRDIQ